MSVFASEVGARKAKNGWEIDPVKILRPNHELQGRFSAEPKNVMGMVNDLLEHGQEQNVIIRKNHENQPLLVAGNRRHAAGVLINTKREDKEFLAGLTEKALAALQTMADQPFLLKVELRAELNDQDAFMANVRENVGREDLSPMDRLKIILTLRDKFKMKDKDIAAVFGKEPWYVYHHLKLASLNPEIQDAVDKGILSLEVAAKHLATTPEESRMDLFKELMAAAMAAKAEEMGVDPTDVSPEEISRITGSMVAEAERKRRTAKGDDSGKSIKRTLADIRKTLTNHVEASEDQDDPVRKIAVTFLSFANGEISEQTFFARIRKMLAKVRAAA